MSGENLCSARDCGRRDAAECAYKDRRGRPCGTSWCPDHQIVLDETVYCRRHAGIINALRHPDPLQGVRMPDIDNRAPSLVNWVANAVDARVVSLLNAKLDAEAGEQIRGDVVHNTKGDRGAITWERGWQIFDHRGTHIRVSVQVEEREDTAVLVRVNGRLVFEQVPPWIEARKPGIHPLGRGEVMDREIFYAQVVEAIQKALGDI